MRLILTATAFAIAFVEASAAQTPTAGTTPPVLIERQECEYTESARKAKVEGTVHLSGVIGTDGKVTEIVLVRPLGEGLGDRAIECVRKWKFQPATRNGAAVKVRANLQVPFHISR